MAEKIDGEVDCEVVYASAPGQATHLPCRIESGATLQQAIESSGILQAHPDIDLTVMRVGIFGKLKPLDQPARTGDRIEIYRPLKIDPKMARRLRAEEKAR
ncbi:MAG: RnfH family protein [Burkholderiaceae bacterium]|nr:MAG: RnfH family protein [Burkholderiaceae bacterium]